MTSQFLENGSRHLRHTLRGELFRFQFDGVDFERDLPLRLAHDTVLDMLGKSLLLEEILQLFSKILII